MQRIAEPKPDQATEFDDLEQLYIKMSAEDLGIELACDKELELDYKSEVRERPDVVIQAFVKVTEIDNSKVWDQFLVENLLMPSLKACKKLPDSVY